MLPKCSHLPQEGAIDYKHWIHLLLHIYTLKNMDTPSHWVTFLNYIFNPVFGFVHI